MYLGAQTDEEYINNMSLLKSSLSNGMLLFEYTFNTPYEFIITTNSLEESLTVIDPNNYYGFLKLYLPDNDMGGPSVLINRNTVQNGDLTSYLSNNQGICYANTEVCKSLTFSICQDITGNINSPQASQTSLSPGMRSAGIYYFLIMIIIF